jgi:asparagine N-glycosylation enzyme membrane subunit Stt3
VTPAPPVLDFALGYGLLGLLAIVGIWIIVRQRLNPASAEWLVLLWAVITVVLVYLPFDLQRRLINGLHIPVCILAAIGLSRWLTHIRLKLGRRRLITNSVVTIGALGTLLVWSFPLLGMLTPPSESVTTALFFLREEEIVALNWLRENSNSNDVILASPRLGMFVPDQTGARAFYGHPFETIEAEAKKSMVEKFYHGEIETVSPPPDFVIYGPSEQSIGQPKNLTEYPVVFSTKNVVVYKKKNWRF